MSVLTPVDPATADTLFTPAPTFTLTKSGTSTIAGATQVLPPDARFTYLGASGFAYGSTFPDTVMYQPNSRYPHTWATPASWGYTFTHTGRLFEIAFKAIATSTTMLRLIVDGKRVTDLVQSPGTLTAGSRYVYKVDFGSSTTRTITVQSATMPFGGLWIAPGDTVTAAPTPTVRTVFFGDSLTGGSAQNTGIGSGTWMWRFAQYMSIADPWNQAIGGTGYIENGTAVNLAGRVDADVIGVDPDVVFLFAGYNDDLDSQTDIASAAASLYSTLKSGLPGAEIYVVGCWNPSATPVSVVVNTDETLRQAALAAGLPFISPVTGKVYDGTGTVKLDLGQWITSSNIGLIGTDSTHPTDAGHAFVADQMRQSVTALIAAGPVIGSVTASGSGTASSITAPSISGAVASSGAGSTTSAGAARFVGTVGGSGSGTASSTAAAALSVDVAAAGGGSSSSSAVPALLAAVPASGSGSASSTAPNAGVVAASGRGVASSSGIPTLTEAVAASSVGSPASVGSPRLNDTAAAHGTGTATSGNTAQNITVTATLGARRWTAAIASARYSATVDPRRWAGRVKP